MILRKENLTAVAPIEVDDPDVHMLSDGVEELLVQSSQMLCFIDPTGIQPTSSGATSSPSSPSPPPPSLTWSGRPHREYQLPKHFRDILPEPPAPVSVDT